MGFSQERKIFSLSFASREYQENKGEIKNLKDPENLNAVSYNTWIVTT